ncbi:MAG: hypothetical protein R3Y04_08750 [Rikenellaceae bacterium]
MIDLLEMGVIPVDYSVLESMLTDYSSPRHKIASLEKSGDLMRLKRGLYVVSPKITKKTLSTELIANHLYGPSYVSYESALRYYGLIPESVYGAKSVTIKRSRNFENSIAKFSYTYCNEDYYPIGVRQEDRDSFTFLIATPEKALCDLIAYTPNLRPRFKLSMLQFLEYDLRLDMDEFYKMNTDIFKKCLAFSKKKNDILNLIKLLER